MTRMKQDHADESEYFRETEGEKLERLRRSLSCSSKCLFIDGFWRPALSGDTFEVEDPSCGAAVAQVAAGSGDDVDLAVAAAWRAFRTGPWPRLPASKRAAFLFALADEIEKEASDLAMIESIDAGHTLSSIIAGDLPLGLRALRDNAGWATKLGGETAMQSVDQQGANYYLREPIGVAGIITPWNAPLWRSRNLARPLLPAAPR